MSFDLQTFSGSDFISSKYLRHDSIQVNLNSIGSSRMFSENGFFYVESATNIPGYRVIKATNSSDYKLGAIFHAEQIMPKINGMRSCSMRSGESFTCFLIEESSAQSLAEDLLDVSFKFF